MDDPSELEVPPLQVHPMAVDSSGPLCQNDEECGSSQLDTLAQRTLILRE